MTKLLFFLLVFYNSTSFAQQEVYATTSSGDLYSFDIENCTRTLIGSTGLGFADIAFTTNNELWGITNGNLYHINKSNGNSSFVSFTGVFSVSLVGVNDTLLFAEDQTYLYTINTINGQSNLIGYIGYSADGDLIWDGTTLYMLTPFVKIEINSSINEVISVTSINTTIPYSAGGVIYGEQNKLVGFSGADVYEICQIDGSYNLLCPNLNISGTPGAASTLAYYNPVNSVNVISPNSDGINDFFQPNSNLENIETIEIFNRWGKRIISLNYPFIWDGKSENGKFVVEGVYFYFVKIKNNCTNETNTQGVIHIIK